MNSEDDSLFPVDHVLPTGKCDPKEEEVFGDDDRRKVENTHLRPWCQVCCLEYFQNGDWIPYATGWIAAPKLIITAGHNLFHPENDQRLESIRVSPGRVRGEQAYPHGVYKSRATAAAWEEIGDSQSPRLDFAAIFLHQPLPSQLGAFSLFDPSRVDDLSSRRVAVSGYPRDPGFCMQQYWAEDDILRVEGGQIFYRADTKKGQSGSPVMLKDEHSALIEVVGIHSAMAEDSAPSPPSNTGPFLSAEVIAQIESWKQQSEVGSGDENRPKGIFAGLKKLGQRLFGK